MQQAAAQSCQQEQRVWGWRRPCQLLTASRAVAELLLDSSSRALLLLRSCSKHTRTILLLLPRQVLMVVVVMMVLSWSQAALVLLLRQQRCWQHIQLIPLLQLRTLSSQAGRCLLPQQVLR